MTTTAEDVHTVVMGIGDLNGIVRGKRIPRGHWATIAEEGMCLSNAMFALDMTCDIWDTPYTNMATGYPDVRVFPMTDELLEMPWDPGAAFVMGRARTEQGEPVPIDPREVLVRVMATADAMGYAVKVGAELEFYLLDAETMEPRDDGIQVYGLERAMELESVLGPIRKGLDAAGIPVEQSNPEYAPGQVEVNIRYGDALAVADQVVAFRGMVKQIAVTQGMRATFMAKPFYEHSGSGFHVHHSLWEDGRNAFARDGRLSPVGCAYLAGMRRRMHESSICAASTPNAFRRRQPNTFCPINDAWGYDNRTVALRVIEGADAHVRIEQRDGSADTNPYLLIAAQVAAGLEGIVDGCDPGPPELADAYVNDAHTPLPVTHQQAIDAAEGSTWLRELMGDAMFELWLAQARREVVFIDSQVTPVERDRYLGAF